MIHSLQFELSRLPKISLGRGSFDDFLACIASYPSGTVVIVTGQRSYQLSDHFDRLKQTIADLSSYSLQHVICPGEPSPELIDESVAMLKGQVVSQVIGLGGGSALDCAKAISAMLCESEGITHYLEGVGDLTPSGQRFPLVMIPTTSGTGSEVTKNAVISSIGKDGFKKSLRHEGYIADHVIIDSELLIHCPPEVTAACGMDAITQLLEAYLSPQSSIITDMLALSGLEKALTSVVACSQAQTVSTHPNDKSGDVIHAHRLNMAYAAMLSGICLAHAGLGVVHGYASPMGAQFEVPHGVVCANLLPVATQVNVKAMRTRMSNHPALRKLAKVARLTHVDLHDDDDAIDALIASLFQMIETLRIKRLGHYGMLLESIEAMAKTLSQKCNPIDLTEDELITIGKARL